MLGIDSAVLRELWCGPLADLMVKLTGKNGLKVRTELTKFLREQECWSEKRPKNSPVKPPVLNLRSIESAQTVLLRLLGSHYSDWTFIYEGCYEINPGSDELDLERVRLIPGPGYRQAAVCERGDLRKDRGYELLGAASLVACWDNRHRLPLSWREAGCIYFDGFALQAPHQRGAEPFNHQWCVSMFHNNVWCLRTEKIDGSQRHGSTSCSAVHI